MLQLHEEADGKILNVTISGKLTADEYRHFVPEVERAIDKHGRIRVVFRMHDFHGWSLGAFWEDIKFDARHFADIERVALIGQQRWQHGMAVFCKPFTMATVRYFDEHQSQEADDWIWADLPAQPSVKGQQPAAAATHDRVQEASEESFPASDSPAY
jgi:hypothetical protein